MSTVLDRRYQFTQRYLAALQAQYGGELQHLSGTYPQMTDTPTQGQTLSFLLTRLNQQWRYDKTYDWNILITYPTNPYIKRLFYGVLRKAENRTHDNTAAALLTSAIEQFFVPDGATVVSPAPDDYRTIDPSKPMVDVIQQALAWLTTEIVGLDWIFQLDLEPNNQVRIKCRVADEIRYIVAPASS